MYLVKPKAPSKTVYESCTVGCGLGNPKVANILLACREIREAFPDAADEDIEVVCFNDDTENEVSFWREVPNPNYDADMVRYQEELLVYQEELVIEHVQEAARKCRETDRQQAKKAYRAESSELKSKKNV